MFGMKISGVITAMLAIIALVALLFGSTWFTLVIGIIDIFAALWWVGDIEADKERPYGY